MPYLIDNTKYLTLLDEKEIFVMQLYRKDRTRIF